MLFKKRSIKTPIGFKKIPILVVILLAAIFLISAFPIKKGLYDTYERQDSVRIEDTKGIEICSKPNPKGYYARYESALPDRFKELLVRKEDRYFYYHRGFNPVSIGEVVLEHLGLGKREASSTITQQLAKILLGNEKERNLKNKIGETWQAVSLEIYGNKDDILDMYANSIYFGNKAQGIFEASHLYFGVDAAMLSDAQIIQLLAAISSPNENNPAQDPNVEVSRALAKRLGLDPTGLNFIPASAVRENMERYSHWNDVCFEYSSFAGAFSSSKQLTLDSELNRKIRKIVSENIKALRSRDATDAAVVVLKVPENEILALVGSPDPTSGQEGYQIDMLREPRAIGSTIKPFIYVNAFRKGLRPYTVVDDREYKYITALGFPLYPKNFDWKYRGEVTLHYALSNSLNVPAVKVLEYVGLENFYGFLEEDLNFKSVQPLDNYQLGIALGSLEMDLMDLGKYFTIFTNGGILKELKINKNDALLPPKKIVDPQYVELVNKILNDRRTGIEQFGLKSDLNLFQSNYALKTGTSRDYKDSWVMGYTPDFLVGVWVGNPDSSAMDNVTGQKGAGKIWSETMDLLLNSSYNKKTPFKFDSIREFVDNDNMEYGLTGDNYTEQKNILRNEDGSLIITPHNDDSFLYEKGTQIILKARQNVKWFVNSLGETFDNRDERFLEESESGVFTPPAPGWYKIRAENAKGQEETAVISINQ